MRRFGQLVGLMCLLMLICPAVFGVQYFETAQSYNVGSYPIGIAAADFNGDNKLDLVTANNAGNNISVLLGNGNGTFGAATNYSTGASQSPTYVRVSDMDKDGNLDIVTGGTMGLVTFYGVGDGTFAAADVYYFGEQVLDIVIADFDQDTYLDIATSHAVRDSVGVHINNHDSTYTSHFVATGYGTVSLDAGYLDADNYIDLAVGCSEGTVWKLINDQAGSFVASNVHFGYLNDPMAVKIIDLNGDQFDDFAVKHSISDMLFTIINNGDDTYTYGTIYDPGDYPSNLTVADVNYDNEDDLLVVIQTTEEIKLYLGQGNGSFTYDSSYTITGTPKEVIFADMNGDNYNDLVVPSYNTDDACVLLSRLTLVLSVDELDNNGLLPEQFELMQNYPNPFNPETKIRFSLPNASDVKIEVFNMLGQSVMMLVNEHLSAGLKEVTWNGVNRAGQKVASGTYLYRITTDQFSDSKKMVILK